MTSFSVIRLGGQGLDERAVREDGLLSDSPLRLALRNSVPRQTKVNFFAAFDSRSDSFDLEFEIRLSGLRSYECPFEEGRPQRKKRALFIFPHLELGGADRCNLDVIA